MHHLGRSLGLDCDCQDLHTCDVLVQGAGNVPHAGLLVNCVQIFHFSAFKAVSENKTPHRVGVVNIRDVLLNSDSSGNLHVLFIYTAFAQ